MTEQNIEKKKDLRSRGGRVSIAPSLIYLISFLIFSPLIIYQISLLTRDMIHADGSIEKLIIHPRYEILRIPETSLTMKYDAVGRMAADFANVYFPAQDLSGLEKEYFIDSTSDPWKRPSRYAPFIDFICAVSICRLSYGYAAVLHILVQLIIFFTGLGIAFKELQISKYMPPSIHIVMVCVFLTPAGLSWIERGQYSLYVALSYLWLFLAIIKEKKLYIVLSALFAFVKWTSFPYLALFFCIYFLAAADVKEVRRRIVPFVFFAVTVEVLFLLFGKSGILFVAGLASQEMYAPSLGISLTHILPRLVVKFLPLLLILIGYVSIRKGNNSIVSLIPYFVGAAIFLLTFPTIAFEYNILSIFGLIPFVIYWWKLPGNAGLPANIFLYSFFLFLILGSLSVNIFRTDLNTTIFHVLISCICMSIPFFQKYDLVTK